GDFIYYFSKVPAKILKSVHTEANKRWDLSGIYTLFSIIFAILVTSRSHCQITYFLLCDKTKCL
ncbi:MAG TPA: hypothetical protein VL053_17885, partial [Arachidicoccus sp.]|nr:hypothetical protein [Arachidicoccus sp.]